ncbi:MAG: orotidine-5'-phosphate decarboxylase [Dehalococcoidia bacterium]|nr:MAG: orotidine-5'-phosphate decarboxylase [Dehalococcoidia bacterium]
MKFIEKLLNASRQNDTLVCIGLDPDPKLMPNGMGIFEFNKAIIDSTADLVCSYKLNFAFYEALGAEGIDILKRTVDYIPNDIPTIGDAKRGDIGNTAKAYAEAIFSKLNFSATTTNPYLGFDSIEPFIQYKDRGVFILCRTSNPGSADFQSLSYQTGGQSSSLFELVATKASQWDKYGNIGLVIGATYPQELKIIRENHANMPLLIPGIGAQGGDLEKAVLYGIDANGEKAVINSSRQIIFASKGSSFASAARKAAVELREHINYFRKKPL